MKEDKMKINDIINLLGVLGVIFSLVFVGLELQQSQKIAIAGQVQARAEMLANRSLALMEGEADEICSNSLPRDLPLYYGYIHNLVREGGVAL
jgi:hypothetical protein